MTHADAIKSLSSNFDLNDWLIFTECSMRSDCIPDLMMFKKSYARAETRIYEVKVTLADLRQDVKKMKFQKYFDYADRVFFAIGPGIKVETAKEILDGQQVGIVSHRGGVWVTNKPAPRLAHEKKIDWELFLALMMGARKLHRDDRYSRLEREHMLVMASEIHERYKIHNRELDKKIQELGRMRDELSDVEKNADRRAMIKLREQLGITKHWASEGFVRDMFRQVVEKKFEEAVKIIKDQLCGVAPDEVDF